MKKYLIVLLLLICTVSLTGCGKENAGDGGISGIGSKQVSCTKTETEDGLTTTETMTVTFKSEKLNYFKGESKVTYPTEEEALATYAYMGMATASLKELGYEVKTNQNGKDIIMSYEGNAKDIIKKAKELGIEEYDYSEDTKYTDFKTEMEADGYTCK